MKGEETCYGTACSQSVGRIVDDKPTDEDKHCWIS